MILPSCYQEPRLSVLRGSWVRGQGLLGGSFCPQPELRVNALHFGEEVTQSILPEAELRTQKVVKVVGMESRSGCIRRLWFPKPACPPTNQGENCIGTGGVGVASQR